MGEESCHLTLKNFPGFKKLLETNKEEILKSVLPPFSIEQNVDPNLFLYKVTTVQNSPLEIKGVTPFQKRFIQSLEKSNCYILKPRKTFAKNLPQEYFSSPQFDEICSDFQLRNQRLKSCSQPIPFETKSVHLFECFNPTVQINDTMYTYVTQQPHVLKQMISVSLENIMFSIGLFEPLIICLAVYNYKTREKQTENIYTFITAGELRKDTFLVELEKIEKNEYYLVIQIFRKDDGNTIMESLYANGVDTHDSKKSKKHLEVIDKVKKKEDNTINMISLQQIAFGSVRIMTITQKTHMTDLKFISIPIKEDADIYKAIKTQQEAFCGRWGVCFDLINKPELLNPLSPFQIVEATQTQNIYGETPRSNRQHQRIRPSKSKIFNIDETPSTLTCPMKTFEKQPLIRVQNVSPSHVFRSETSVSSSFYFTILELILSREQKIVGSIEVSLHKSINEEPMEAIIIPNYSIKPEKKLIFSFKGSEKTISIFKEIRIELPKPPTTDLFIMIKMIDKTESVAFLPLYSKNGDIIDSGTEHRIPIYKGSGDKFTNDAFNGKGASKRTLKVKIISTATLYPRLHIIHSFINSDDRETTISAIKTVKSMDAKVIAPYLNTILDRMFEMIEFVEMYNFIPILEQFFTEEEIRPVILLDYVNDHFSPRELNLNCKQLPKLILLDILKSFNNFEEEEFTKFKLMFFFFQCFIKSCVVAGNEIEDIEAIEKSFRQLFGLIVFRMDIHISKRDIRGIFELNLNVAELFRDLFSVMNKDFVCECLALYYNVMAERNAVKLDKQTDLSYSTVFEIMRLDFLCIIRDYPLVVEINCPTIRSNDISSLNDTYFQSKFLATFFIYSVLQLILYRKNDIRVMAALCLLELIQKFDVGIAYQEYRSVAAEEFSSLITFMVDEFDAIKEWTEEVNFNINGSSNVNQLFALRALFACFFYIVNEMSDEFTQTYLRMTTPITIHKLLQLFYIGQLLFKSMDHHMQGTQGLFDFLRNKLVMQLMKIFDRELLTIRSIHTFNTSCAIFMQRSRGLTITSKEEGGDSERKRKRRHNTTKESAAPVNSISLIPPNVPIEKSTQQKVNEEIVKEEDPKKRTRKFSLFITSEEKKKREEERRKEEERRERSSVVVESLPSDNTNDNSNDEKEEKEKKGVKKVLMKPKIGSIPSLPIDKIKMIQEQEIKQGNDSVKSIREMSEEVRDPTNIIKMERKSTSLPKLNIRRSTVVDRPKNIGFQAAKELYGPLDDVCPKAINRNVQIKQDEKIVSDDEKTSESTKRKTLPSEGLKKPPLQRFESNPKMPIIEISSQKVGRRSSIQRNNALFKSADLGLADLLVENSHDNNTLPSKPSSTHERRRSQSPASGENNDSNGKTLLSRSINGEFTLECSEDISTAELAKAARTVNSSKNNESAPKPKVIRRRKGSMNRVADETPPSLPKIKPSDLSTSLTKSENSSENVSPQLINNNVEAPKTESSIYKDDVVVQTNSEPKKGVKSIKIPRLELKKVQKEESIKVTQLESPEYIVAETQANARLRTSTSIQISPPLNRMVKQSSLAQSMEKGVKKFDAMPAIEFMFGLPLETPRNKQRRQTEGGEGVKTPRGMEESFITEKAGINNEKVMNVYLFGIINTIVSKASTMCFLYHDHNEEVRKMAGKVFAELSLSLNSNAFVSDLTFLGLEKFIRVCGDEVVPLISPITQSLMQVVLKSSDCIAPRAAEIIWLLCFMNYISKQSVSASRDAMITYLFHGETDFQKLPNLVCFLQSVPFVRLQAMFDMLVQQRNSSAQEMIKNNQLCLEVQTIDKAIFEGHAEDCLVFFNGLLEKRIELLQEIERMEGSFIGKEMEIQLSLLFLLFRTLKLKEEQINMIEKITSKFYSEQEEIMKQLKRLKSLFDFYMDVHNSIKRNCKSSEQRVGIVREQCGKCKQIVTDFFNHLVGTINEVTSENVRKGASYLNKYQQSYDELLLLGVESNPLFPVTPDELSDIFQMYKSLNLHKGHLRKKSSIDYSNEPKIVKIKSLREMLNQFTNLSGYLRHEPPTTPRMSPRKNIESRPVSSITPKKKRMSIDNSSSGRVIKRTSNLTRSVMMKGPVSRNSVDPTSSLPDVAFQFEHNQLICKLMPDLTKCIESNNEDLTIIHNNEKAQELLTKIVGLLYVSEDATVKLNESDKNHEENKMLMEKLYGVYEWAHSTQILLSFDPPEPNDFLNIFMSMLSIIEQNKEKQMKIYHELQKTCFKTPQQMELMEKINKIILTIPSTKITKTVRDIRKRCTLEEQREIQRLNFAKYYNDFVSLSRQCLLTSQRSEFKAFNSAKEAYHLMNKMNASSVIGINRYVQYVGMEESLEELYQKLIRKGLSKSDSVTELSEITSISFRLTDVSALLKSPIYVTSCNSSSNLIGSIHAVGNEIFSVSLELQGLLSLKGKYQIDELTERYYALCLKYRSSPLLHLSWLNNIIEKEIEFGYYLEAGICEIQAVYYIYRVTKGNDIGILNVSHLATICSDFLIDRKDINEAPLEFTKELLLSHAYHAIELFKKAKMTWFGVEVCLMLKEFFENNNSFDELSKIHEEISEFFLSYADGSSVDTKFYFVELGESQYIYASPLEKQEFDELYGQMCETIGYNIIAPQQVYPIINGEVQTVPVPQITTTNTFTYEIFEGDSEKMMDIVAVKGIFKTEFSLPSGLRRSNVIEQYDEVLTPVRYSIEVVERMIESLSFFVCECEKNGTSSLKAVREMREYMIQNIMNEESFSALSIIKNFFPEGDEEDPEGMLLLKRNLQRLRVCCDKAYSAYQLLSQEIDKIQISFRKKYMIFGCEFANFITNLDDMDLY